MKFIRKNISLGFSIVELIVAIGILALVSGIMVSGYYGMNSRLSTSNLAYDVALVFRQAQVYSSSSKSTADLRSLAEIGQARERYGIRFASYYNNSVLADNKFALFSERNSVGQDITYYRCGAGSSLNDVPVNLSGCEGSEEHDSTYVISSRSRIKSFCVYKAGLPSRCQNYQGVDDIQYVDVVYYGSFAEAQIKTDRYIDGSYDYLEVIFASVPSGHEKKLTIYKTGRISVSN